MSKTADTGVGNRMTKLATVDPSESVKKSCSGSWDLSELADLMNGIDKNIRQSKNHDNPLEVFPHERRNSEFPCEDYQDIYKIVKGMEDQLEDVTHGFSAPQRSMSQSFSIFSDTMSEDEENLYDAVLNINQDMRNVDDIILNIQDNTSPLTPCSIATNERTSSFERKTVENYEPENYQWNQRERPVPATDSTKSDRNSEAGPYVCNSDFQQFAPLDLVELSFNSDNTNAAFDAEIETETESEEQKSSLFSFVFPVKPPVKSPLTNLKPSNSEDQLSQKVEDQCEEAETEVSQILKGNILSAIDDHISKNIRKRSKASLQLPIEAAGVSTKDKIFECLGKHMESAEQSAQLASSFGSVLSQGRKLAGSSISRITDITPRSQPGSKSTSPLAASTTKLRSSTAQSKRGGEDTKPEVKSRQEQPSIVYRYKMASRPTGTELAPTPSTLSDASRNSSFSSTSPAGSPVGHPNDFRLELGCDGKEIDQEQLKALYHGLVLFGNGLEQTVCDYMLECLIRPDISHTFILDVLEGVASTHCLSTFVREGARLVLRFSWNKAEPWEMVDIQLVIRKENCSRAAVIRFFRTPGQMHDQLEDALYCQSGGFTFFSNLVTTGKPLQSAASSSDQPTPLNNTQSFLNSLRREMVKQKIVFSSLSKSPKHQKPVSFDKIFLAQIKDMCREDMLHSLGKLACDMESYLNHEENKFELAFSALQQMFQHFKLAMPEIPTRFPVTSYPLALAPPRRNISILPAANDDWLNVPHAIFPMGRFESEGERVMTAVKNIWDGLIESGDDVLASRVRRKNEQVMDRIFKLRKFFSELLRTLSQASKVQQSYQAGVAARCFKKSSITSTGLVYFCSCFANRRPGLLLLTAEHMVVTTKIPGFERWSTICDFSNLQTFEEKATALLGNAWTLQNTSGEKRTFTPSKDGHCIKELIDLLKTIKMQPKDALEYPTQPAYHKMQALP